jgi:hypothetical protein
LALPYSLVLYLLIVHFYFYDSLLSDLGDQAASYNLLLSFLGHPAANLKLFATLGVCLCVAQVFMIAFEAVAARVIGTVSPGVISRWSLAYIRVSLKIGLVASVDSWLSGSRFYPVWLRVAGMKVGSKCEIGAIIDVVPELIQINSVTFFADGIYLGGPRIQRGTVTLANVLLESNTFLGNHVVVPAGNQLPHDILIGVATVADDRVIRPESSWFGHPPFELLHREVVTVDSSLTSNPQFIRFVNRAFWEWLRFTVPLVPMMGALFWISAVTYAKDSMPFDELLLLRGTRRQSGDWCFVMPVRAWPEMGTARPGT